MGDDTVRYAAQVSKVEEILRLYDMQRAGTDGDSENNLDQKQSFRDEAKAIVDAIT